MIGNPKPADPQSGRLPAQAGPWGWLPLIVGGAVYTAVICVIVVHRAESTTDFRDFWENGAAFVAFGEIRADLGVHNYLPAFTILMSPWALLPLQVSIVVFTLLSLTAFAATVVMAERMFSGHVGVSPRTATLIAIGLMLAYVTSCAVLGALGLVLTFLVVLAWLLAQQGRDVRAGLVLGLATVLKLLPAILLGYFLLRRRWRLAAAAVICFLVLAILPPLLALGPGETWQQHRAFYKRAFVEHSAWTTIQADKPIKANFSNNAVPIVLRRLLSPVNGGKESSSGPLFVNFTELPPDAIWWVYAALMIVLTGVTVLATLRDASRQPSAISRQQGTRTASAGERSDSRSEPPLASCRASGCDAAYGAWCCLMLLAAPLVWTHYLPLLYWPLALAAVSAERQRGGSPAGPGVPSRSPDAPLRVICAAVLLLWLVGVILLASDAARAAGAQIASVVGLWVGAITLSFTGRHLRTQPGHT